MANGRFGEILSNLTMAGLQSVRRNAANNAFEPYTPGGAVFTAGLYSARPAVPSLGDSYWATDLKVMMRCLVAGAWSFDFSLPGLYWLGPDTRGHILATDDVLIAYPQTLPAAPDSSLGTAGYSAFAASGAGPGVMLSGTPAGWHYSSWALGVNCSRACGIIGGARSSSSNNQYTGIGFFDRQAADANKNGYCAMFRQDAISTNGLQVFKIVNDVATSIGFNDDWGMAQQDGTPYCSLMLAVVTGAVNDTVIAGVRSAAHEWTEPVVVANPTLGIVFPHVALTQYSTALNAGFAPPFLAFGDA